MAYFVKSHVHSRRWVGRSGFYTKKRGTEKVVAGDKGPRGLCHFVAVFRLALTRSTAFQAAFSTPWVDVVGAAVDSGAAEAPLLLLQWVSPTQTSRTCPATQQHCILCGNDQKYPCFLLWLNGNVYSP